LYNRLISNTFIGVIEKYTVVSWMNLPWRKRKNLVIENTFEKEIIVILHSRGQSYCLFHIRNYSRQDEKRKYYEESIQPLGDSILRINPLREWNENINFVLGRLWNDPYMDYDRQKRPLHGLWLINDPYTDFFEFEKHILSGRTYRIPNNRSAPPGNEHHNNLFQP